VFAPRFGRGITAGAPSGRRGFVRAAVGIVERVPISRFGRVGRAALLAGRRLAAAHRLMPGPGLWPALAVSEQATLDAPSNTTLQLPSGAVTGRRSSK
jgi:hypothetical protein